MLTGGVTSNTVFYSLSPSGYLLDRRHTQLDSLKKVNIPGNLASASTTFFLQIIYLILIPPGPDTGWQIRGTLAVR